jgi:molybdate transport system ATP-binding protein
MTQSDGRIQARFAATLGRFVLDAEFEAPMRGVTAIFGPSGAGKTTILRCIAGLQRLDGRLTVDGDVWQDDRLGTFRKAHERPIGYVFQEASLFPHLSVRKNLLYGARRAERNGAGRVIAEDEIVGLLGLADLLDRAPQALSGGERQRVAIGRALLSQPRLLLMDEPLSGLDRMRKDDVLPFLEALHRHLSIPIFYVSHFMSEVERLADRLVLLDRGRVLASGALADLQADPGVPLLGGSDAAVVLEGRVSGVDETYGLTAFAVAGGELIVPGPHGRVGDRRRLRISAADVSLALAQPEGSSILNCLPARIVAAAETVMGEPQINIVAALGEAGQGARIVARITRKSRDALGLAPGNRVIVQIKSVALLASGPDRTAL